MAAEVSHGGLEQMHRSTLAFGATRYFSEKLRHRRMRRHPQRKAMAMATIAINQVIPLLIEESRATDSDRFLAAVEVAEPADLHFARAVGERAGRGVFV